MKIEQYLNSKHKSVFAFKPPMVCPFCKVSECNLSKEICIFLSYYSPLHEQYKYTENIKEVFGNNVGSEIHSIILVE